MVRGRTTHMRRALAARARLTHCPRVQIHALCASGLPGYATPAAGEDYDSMALGLLAPANAEVDYMAALLPRVELERAQCRLRVREATHTGSDAAMRTAHAKWEAAGKAADAEAAAVARVVPPAAATQMWRRWYSLLFRGLALLKGYSGSEGSREAEPLSTRVPLHLQRKGAAWTIDRVGGDDEVDIKYGAWFWGTAQEVLVFEVVDLMEGVYYDLLAGIARERRGGPFLCCDRASWGPDLDALWEALRRVPVPWPTAHADRLRILEGIMHTVQGDVMRLYADDLCFECGGTSHKAHACFSRKACAKRKRLGCAVPQPRTPQALQLAHPPLHTQPIPSRRAPCPLVSGPGGASADPASADAAMPDGSQDAGGSSAGGDGSQGSGGGSSGGGGGTQGSSAGGSSGGGAPGDDGAGSDSEGEAEAEGPFRLMFGAAASQPEQTRAYKQAGAQGFRAPLDDGWMALPSGWAIGCCPNGRGPAGQFFALLCVLAHSIVVGSSGGATSHVCVYDINGSQKKKGATRVLLSPAGVAALHAALASASPDVVKRLRAQQADPDNPPVHLIRTLRRAGLKVSLDSRLALPDFDASSDAEIAAWWSMHLAGVAAMERLAGVEALRRWSEAASVFVMAVQRA